MITTDSKILFRDYKILWGDGINLETMDSILAHFTDNNSIGSFSYAAENFVFGSGGDLMQNITRDTQKFAIKCSNATLLDGSGVSVYKSPITDPNKESLKGKVSTFVHKDTEELKTFDTLQDVPSVYSTAMQLIYLNGIVYNSPTLDEIRDRVEKQYE